MEGFLERDMSFMGLGEEKNEIPVSGLLSSNEVNLSDGVEREIVSRQPGQLGKLFWRERWLE